MKPAKAPPVVCYLPFQCGTFVVRLSVAFTVFTFRVTVHKVQFNKLSEHRFERAVIWFTARVLCSRCICNINNPILNLMK